VPIVLLWQIGVDQQMPALPFRRSWKRELDKVVIAVKHLSRVASRPRLRIPVRSTVHEHTEALLVAIAPIGRRHLRAVGVDPEVAIDRFMTLPRATTSELSAAGLSFNDVKEE
jgi:hypothetical protein